MTIRIVTPEDRQLTAVKAKYSQGPTSVTSVARHQVVSEDAPFVQVNRLPAGAIVPAHAHSNPEAFVVLSGTLRLGEKECPAGTVAVIPAGEEYALAVGDDDVVWAVVRPGLTTGVWHQSGDD